MKTPDHIFRENTTEKIGITGITKFALRHWDSKFAGTKIQGLTPDELVNLVNSALQSGAKLVDGYAPFCKHLFVENTTETKAGYGEITEENMLLLRTGYLTRREGELPVLQRWLEGAEAPKAKYLDIILYSREALEDEAAKTPNMERDVPKADWGIVSINAELQPRETPIPPITMLRNALGKEEGGSGVPLDREAYIRSVEFWKIHASIQ